MMARENFFDRELNLERMNEVLEYVIKNLTLKEICKMMREISYDMVCYYDKTNCGIIYRDKDYTKEHQIQACQLQRLLSTACDLFCQSIVNKRVFDSDYLKQYLHGKDLQTQIVDLQDIIKELKKQITALENYTTNKC